jgi:hypothetical protein
MPTVQAAVATGGNVMDADIAHVVDRDFTDARDAAYAADRTTRHYLHRPDHTDMNIINDLIAVVTICPPSQHGSLSVYPLRSGGHHATATYLVLDDAIATGRFRITEVSESGSVPQLLAINDNDGQAFLLDGKELVGAKQNRVLNLSIMLAPKSKIEIPVSCVKAGRWRTESGSFRTEQRVQFARGRARKMEQVSESLRLYGEATSDQSAVWDEISAKSAA